MPKTKTFSPYFVQLASSDTDFLSMVISPIDADGKRRGEVFIIRAAIDGSVLIGPDGATIIAPVPTDISTASISTGGSQIQSALDALDAAHLLDQYY